MNDGNQVHIFYPYKSELGGSELRTLELARDLRELCGARPTVWATSLRSRASFRRKHGVRLWTPLHLWLGGSFIFVSLWKPNPMMKALRPKRLTVIVNVMSRKLLEQRIPAYERICPDVRYVFASDLQRRMMGREGDIHPTSLDITRFSPAPIAERPPALAGQLRVGRHSRDILEKHHLLYDPPLYEKLAAEGVEFDLMGATCLQPLLTRSGGIQLRRSGTEDPAAYLRSLDCFFYRCGTFFESNGRAVLEAMACGLPVVCHRYGGYADLIRHGENGFLFDDQSEAESILRSLRDDPDLRRRIGTEARLSMERWYAPERLRGLYATYL